MSELAMRPRVEGQVCVGLFGTCGGSRWREEIVIPKLVLAGLTENNFFNPQVSGWSKNRELYAAIEADHLANDEVIVFPITNETYAEGSLAETGFSILQALRLDDRRDFILKIDPGVCERLLEEDADRAKASIRSRALVLQHLRKLRLANVFVVDTWDDLTEAVIACYDNQVRLLPFREFNPHRRPPLI